MITLLTVLALAGVPDSPKFDPAEFEFQRPGSELCFPSGLRITLVHDDRQPVVSVSTVINRGAAHDPVGREGSAHLMEHVWFHAQTASGSVQERLSDLGASYNASTLGDATVYLTQADVTVLPELFALEALRLADPLAGIDATILEQERAIVESERQLRGFVVADYPRFLPPGFGGNESGLRPGSPEAIASITFDDLQTVAASYDPSTTTILVTGPVDSAAVQSMVEGVFSDEQLRTPNGTCGGRAIVEDVSPPSLAPRGLLHTVTKPVDEPAVIVGWSLPPAYGADESIMRIVTARAGQRLRELLAHSRFLNPRTSCQFVPGPVSSSLICAATVPEGANGGVILERMTELNGSITTLAEWSTVGRLGLQGISDIVVGLDAHSPLQSDDALRDVLANHYGGSPTWFEDAMDTLNTVESRDVSRLLERWTRPEQAWFSMVVPPDADVDRILAGKSQAAQSEEGEPGPERDERVRPTQAVSHRSPLRRPMSVDLPAPSPPTLSEPVVRTLDNGVRVVVLQHGLAPVGHVALVADGASLTESRLGLDEWAWALTGIDPDLFPAGEPSFAASRLGARLWYEDLGSARSIGLSGSTATLNTQLGVAYDFASSTGRVSEGARQGLRGLYRRRARKTRADLALVQQHAQWGHVIGPDSPFAYSSSLLAFHGGRAGMASVDRHIRTLWHPQNSTVYVVGPQSPDDVLEMVQAQFGDWKERRLREDDRVVAIPPMPTGRASFEAVDPERTSASIRLTCRAPDQTDEVTLDVVTELWREWAHSALRESDIAAYNPSVRSWTVGDTTVMNLSVTVQPEQALAATEAIDGGLAWLSTEVTDADVQRVALRLRSAWAGRFVLTADVLDHLIAHDSGVVEYAETGGARLMNVQTLDVHAVAHTCSVGAALGVLSPQGGAVSESPWGDVLHVAELPSGR